VGAGETQTFYGHCRGNCEGGCRIKLGVREGKLVSTTMGEYTGDPNYNRICAKGLSHINWTYNPSRLKVPLRRAGERGAGEWEEITWDEALEEIATKWKTIIDETGPSGIIFSAGTGSAGFNNRLSTKLVNLIGAGQVHYCYDMAFNYGTENVLGVGNGWNTNEGSHFYKTRCFVVWGANMTEAHPHYWHVLLESKQAGAKMIVIDPRFTITASKADLYVPIRPATDAALFMCLTNLTIKNEKHDVAGLKKLTVAPFLVKSDGKYLRKSDLGVPPEEGPINPQTGQPTIIDPIVVRGEDGTTDIPSEVPDPVIEGRFTINGVKVTTAFTLLKERVAEWPIERASELCDIPEETILEVWETILANSPVHGFQGFGPDHYKNGHLPYFAMQSLLAVTGNLGKDGSSGGNGFPWGNAFRMVTYAINALPPEFRAGPTVPTNMLAQTILDEELFGTPWKIRSAYFWVHNPVANIPQRQKTIEAFNKLDFVVVADSIMTDSCSYADLVLPACHWFEEWDMFIAGSPFAVLSEKAIDPLYESKSDFDIFTAIGKKMGWDEHFTLTEEEFLAKHFDNGIGGFTWEQFKQEKCFFDPVKRSVHEQPIPTATQRFQFYRETVTPNLPLGQKVDPADLELERMPYWEPPNEAWNVTAAGFEKNPLSEQYPLIYTSERSKLKTHTEHGRSQWLLELIPEPICKLSRKDAIDRGISTGDYVKVFNDRGYVVAMGVVNDGLRPGMIVFPKGWQKDQFKDGHYNDLTSRATDDVCINNNYFDSLVQVEKVEEGVY
jgi:molybdopterin-containing oxidoreductase family molybdopterin binding subunit